jgi:hypothetical protein
MLTSHRLPGAAALTYCVRLEASKNIQLGMFYPTSHGTAPTWAISVL